MIFIDPAGPSDADWWIVWLTGFSVVVSGVLAWLAYRNGRRATKIAQEASERDEEHRRREVDQREREERSAVAMAMARAVSATEQYTRMRDKPARDRERGHAELIAEAAREMQRCRSEALAAVGLYTTEPEDDELLVWIDAELEHLAKRPTTAMEAVERHGEAYHSRRAIRLWNGRQVTSGKMLAGMLPPEIEADDEAPVPSA